MEIFTERLNAIISHLCVNLHFTSVSTCLKVLDTWWSHETINHITAAQTSSLPTLKEPNIPWLVFKGGVDVVGNPPPVAGCQRRVTTLQMPVPDPPHVARLEEEQLPSNHRHGIKVRLAGVGLENKTDHLFISTRKRDVSNEGFLLQWDEVSESRFIVWIPKIEYRGILCFLRSREKPLSYTFYKRK